MKVENQPKLPSTSTIEGFCLPALGQQLIRKEQSPPKHVLVALLVPLAKF